MANEFREHVRAKILEQLHVAFPNAQDVVGGVAFYTDEIDPETGMLQPVEIKFTVPLTKDTVRGSAYDLEAKVAAAANRPGRRVADPAKAAAKAAAAEKAKERTAANVAIARKWCTENLKGVGMLASQIKELIPEFETITPMQVGVYLKALQAEGVVTFTLDEKRRKMYTLAE